MIVKHDAVNQYACQFGRIFDSQHIFSFWKGRVALYAILKGLSVGEGDEVILPGYTCVMDVTPIKYLRAKPVYVDIAPELFNVNVDLLEQKITPRTKVIIAQHTYGYPAEMDAIMAVAHRKGITVIEDCCLALGSRYQAKMVGTFGEASYFSSQWNKPYTTGLGGIALCHDLGLAEKIDELCRRELLPVPLKKSFFLGVQLAVYRSVIYPRTTAMMQEIFRWLTHKGLVIGSSSDEELADTVKTEDFFMGMSSIQARSGLRQLRKLQENLAHRKMMAKLYDDLLARRGWRIPKVPAYMDPVLVRYPVRITEKDRAVKEAGKHQIELGAWFLTPLHDVKETIEMYDYQWGMCPEAERASKEVVNLPVHPRTNEKTAIRTVEYLCRFKQVE